MCKRLRITAALVLTLMITAGCASHFQLSDSHVDIYKRIHDKYNRMKSYTAEVTLTVKSRKSEQVYRLSQQVKEPELAAITIREPDSLSGLRTVFNGSQVRIESPAAPEGLVTTTQKMPNALLVNQFFSIYYQSEETAISVNSQESGGTMLLETECRPQKAEAYKVTLLLDTKTLEPKNITVFDVGGNVRMLAEFTEFVYNPSLPEEIFFIQ
ncbi:MAG: outer membrane lipoprotein carrier protein LolA [Ruminococcaceae bacterium]|nr:outer membrane lipoprotein carrier protein LolA [Oscillospiraceae bacterium]